MVGIVSYLLVSLSDSVDVNQAVIGADGEVRSVRRKLHLVDHLLSVLDVNDLHHVSETEKNILLYDKETRSECLRDDSWSDQHLLHRGEARPGEVGRC